jgi:hypothetical protein
MAERGAHDVDPVDPLEASAPRPSTFAERRVIATVGALAIVVGVGILVRVLGSGATPTSARDELTAARPGKNHPAAPARPGE